MEKKLKYALNLQLFAEGGDSGGAAQGGSNGDAGAGQAGGTAVTPAAPATQGAAWPGLPDRSLNPLFQTEPAHGQPPATGDGQTIGQPQTTQQQMTQQQQQQEILDFAGRQVPVVDPTIRDLHRDWTNLNRTYQETNQQARQLQEQNQMLMNMLQQATAQQQQAQTAQQPQAPQGPTAEELQAFNEKYLETFYENPIEANKMLMQNPLIQGMIQQQVDSVVKSYIEPIQRERQLSNEYQQLVSQYPDFNDTVPAMREVIQKYPDLENAPLERVYLLAKGLTAQQSQPQLSIEQMLSNPDIRSKVMELPDIRQAIINQYRESVQTTQQQTPNVIAGQAGGQVPVIQQNKPKTVREATSAWLRSIGQ